VYCVLRYKTRHQIVKAEKADLSAYRSVFRVCSQQLRPGDIIAICAH